MTETDDAGNQTRIDWTYDDLGRLTRESYDSHDDALDFIADYTYDLAGNREQKQTDTDPSFVGEPTFDEAITYVSDDNDRLLTETRDAPGAVDDRFTEYGYDATQQTAKTVYEGLDNTGDVVEDTSYTYNVQGRLSKTEIDTNDDGNPDTRIEYEYNADGIRVAQTVTVDSDQDGDLSDETPTRTEYLIDENNHTGFAQVLEETDGAGTLVKSYTIGLDVFAEAVAANVIRYLLKDGHGSTRGLVDAAGLPLSSEIYRYDAFGNPIGFDADNAATTLQYNSEQRDRATGLIYLRARYYDTATGRFTRLDPYLGTDPRSLHKYAFTSGDPIQFGDPTGLYEGLIGLIMSMNWTSINRANSQTANLGALSYARQALKLLEFAQTIIEIASSAGNISTVLHGIIDGDIKRIVDLLTGLDDHQYKKITDKLLKEGLTDGGLTVLAAAEPIYVNIDLPTKQNKQDYEKGALA